MVQMVERGAGKLWDLGSIPRSPHFISYILFQYNPMQLQPQGSPYTQYSSTPHVPERPSKGPDLMNIILTSQRVHTLPGKVKRARVSMGQNC